MPNQRAHCHRGITEFYERNGYDRTDHGIAPLSPPVGKSARLPNEHLGPEAERRLVLKWFGLSESEISHLAALDDQETEWRVQHEHRVMASWCDRRRDFLLAECMNGTKYKPVVRTTTIVNPRKNNITSISGERLA